VSGIFVLPHLALSLSAKIFYNIIDFWRNKNKNKIYQEVRNSSKKYLSRSQKISKKKKNEKL
jgi:hypothetical protein